MKIRYAFSAAVLLAFGASLVRLTEFFGGLAFNYPWYLLVYAFLALVAFGFFGRMFGLSNLLWHENGRTQFIAGAGVASLVVMMASISYEILRDHDNDRLMGDMRQFRDAAPITLLTGPGAWPVDVWEQTKELEGLFLEALRRSTVASTGAAVDGRAVGQVGPAAPGPRDGGPAPIAGGSPGSIKQQFIRIQVYEEYYNGRPLKATADLERKAADSLRNRSLLYLCSVAFPLIGVLCLPAVLNGTPVSRRWVARRGSPAGPLTFGAGGGMYFVAGSAAVAVAAGLAAYWLPEPFLRMVKLSGFGLIPYAEEKVWPWTLFNTSMRLFFEIVLSQVLFGATLVFLIWLCRRRGVYRRISPPVSLCLILALFIIIYGIYVHLAFLHPLFQAGAAGLIGLLVLSMNRNVFKVRFPRLTVGKGGPSYYGSAYRVNIKQFYFVETVGAGGRSGGDADQDIGLLDSESVLEKWKSAAPASVPQGKPVLAVVTTSGGSIRAAVWTAKVLTKLEREIGGFPYHLRLVTGASGGMLGASLYVADLDEPDRESPGWPRRPIPRLKRSLRGLPKDSLTSVARCLALRDLPGLLRWGPLPTDRGRALEEAWAESDGAFAKPFRDLAAGEAAGWRPSLVFSPVLVEDGRRLLISNLDLGHLTANVGPFLLDDSSKRLQEKAKRHETEDLYSLSAYQFYRLFPRADDFRLSTAVRMSATFPFISPAVSLPTSPPRRVVDAGYYDNFGVNAAAMWVMHHRDWLLDNTSGVVLIQVRAFDSPRDVNPPELSAGTSDGSEHSWTNGLNAVAAPLRSVLQARKAVMSYRNDEQLEVVADWFRDHAVRPDFFQNVSFECRAAASLSWHITGDEFRAILGGFEPSRGGGSFEAGINRERLEALKRWWASSAQSTGPGRRDAPASGVDLRQL